MRLRVRVRLHVRVRECGFVFVCFVFVIWVGGGASAVAMAVAVVMAAHPPSPSTTTATFRPVPTHAQTGHHAHPMFKWLKSERMIPTGGMEDTKGNGCADIDALVLPRDAFGGTTVVSHD